MNLQTKVWPSISCATQSQSPSQRRNELECILFLSLRQLQFRNSFSRTRLSRAQWRIRMISSIPQRKSLSTSLRPIAGPSSKGVYTTSLSMLRCILVARRSSQARVVTAQSSSTSITLGLMLNSSLASTKWVSFEGDSILSLIILIYLKLILNLSLSNYHLVFNFRSFDGCFKDGRALEQESLSIELLLG